MDARRLLTRYNGFAPWARIVIALALGLLVVGLALRASEALHVLIFGDTEARRERGNAVVAREQTRAESNIADQAIATVHERDVYREHVREVVRDSQERVNGADHGQQMDPAIDAAVADGLCRVHDSLCRRSPGAAPLQPLRRPVPRAD